MFASTSSTLLDFFKWPIVGSVIHKWLDLSIIEPSNSEFSNLLVHVIKTSGSSLIYTDGRQTNELIIMNLKRSEKIDEIILRFQCVIFISNLDSVSSYPFWLEDLYARVFKINLKQDTASLS